MLATLPGEFSTSVITKAIAALYGVVRDIGTFIDEHIAAMKASPNATIARTGRVIEGAKYGFGIGYFTDWACH